MIEVLSISKSYYEAAKRPPSLSITSYCSNTLARIRTVEGFIRGLSQVIDPAGKAIVIFGAGGAARTVGVELALAGASRIFVVNRGQERGQQLVTLLLEKTPAAELSPKPRELPA
jgi:shikimate 5-dehydrogenase